MRVLLCPDKFKGSLTAREVCDALAVGVRRASPGMDIVAHPMADGGDGSLEVLATHLDLSERRVATTDPLGRPIVATYRTNADTAFVELASASGLVLLTSEERNPARTSSYGTGVLIADAIARGFREVVLFLGGSATSDAGTGIVAALGGRFLDAAGQALAPYGKTLPDVLRIDLRDLTLPSDFKLTLLCDVTNPFSGPNGAAHVYAPQKGASEPQVAALDAGLAHLAGVLEATTGRDVQELSGAGAAGGIGGGLAAMLGAELKPGFETLAELTGLAAEVAVADLVITGEGCLDGQSLEGKVVGGVAALCREVGKPLAVVAGASELSTPETEALGVTAVYTIVERAAGEQDAMAGASAYLEMIGAEALA